MGQPDAWRRENASDGARSGDVASAFEIVGASGWKIRFRMRRVGVGVQMLRPASIGRDRLPVNICLSSRELL
jgi:hypothetical protein